MTDREPLIPDEGLAPASGALPGAAGPLKEFTAPPRSQWLNVWDQFKHHKGAMAGGIIFLAIVVLVFLGPLVWTIDPTHIDIRARNQGLSLAHPFGTDQLGRDTLARMMAGGRTSVAVGIAAMLLALFLGSLVGVAAGYFRRLDDLLMRLTDLFLALPLLPLLLVMMLLFREPLSATFGPEQGIFILIVCAIGITSWMPRRSWSRPRWASPTRSSPKARCPSSASASRRTSRHGAAYCSTRRTTSSNTPSGCSGPAWRSR